jgi:HIP---CoA ligase
VTVSNVSASGPGRSTEHISVRTISSEKRTIPALTVAAAEQFGDLVAVVDGDTTLRYAELLERARTFAAALVVAGIAPGDRVSIWAFNSAEWIVSALGVWQAGAVLVPINTRFKGAEAADILSRSHAKLLVTVTDFLGADYVAMLQSAGVELPDLETIVVIKGEVPEGTDSWSHFMARATERGRAQAALRATEVSPEDPSDILFTSGTTGSPKGVVQTHSRTLFVATDWTDMTGLRAGDRYLMVNPYFHMFGLKAGILACTAVGATMLPEQTFEVSRALERIANDKVTCLPGAPALFQSVLDHPDLGRHDLSSLRVATIGAADIPVELIRRILDELPYEILISGYGLTEGGTAASTTPDDDVETIATTVGRPRPSFETRIVDADGNDLPHGEGGEILLRGRSVMLGYLDDPQATERALSPDGWLSTGDVGRLDESGRLRIVGRVKDMFIVGGFNAYPVEIENALLRHPDVQHAAVIGVPDRRLGEVGMAFVVLRPGSELTEGDVIAWSRDQMANYKVPRVVEFVAELPFSATGKVMKDLLRERAGLERP